jgi:hypothetical protein
MNSAVNQTLRKPPAPVVPAAKTAFIAFDWKAVQKNTLIGFCSLETPSGVIYRQVSVHQQNDSRWIGMPARPWQKSDGSTAYVQIIEFRDKAAKDRFQSLALAAIDALLAAVREEDVL